MFYAGNYEETTGACRNQNGEFDDIFFSNDVTYSKSRCKEKCDSMVGCGAVSYQKDKKTCHGTSRKVTTSSESTWTCYYKKSGYKPSTHRIEN